MARYRKKPVVIEAMQFYQSMPLEQVLQWANAASLDAGTSFDVGLFSKQPDGALRIQTLEGAMLAIDGDWIIRGVKGEFYPCKPEIFAATYELVP